MPRHGALGWGAFTLVVLLQGGLPALAHHGPLNTALPDPWAGLVSGLAIPSPNPVICCFCSCWGSWGCATVSPGW